MSAATSTSAMANSIYNVFNLNHHQHRRLPAGHHRSSSQVSATIFNQHSNIQMPSTSSTYKHVNTNFLGNIQGLSINFDKRDRIKRSNIIRKMDVTVYAGIIPGIPLPSSENWKGWVIGLLLSIALPLLKHKSPFLALKQEVVKVVVSIDSVAEIIEKVAEGVEKVADEVADHLPEGKLKVAARCLESIAHETAKDAHIADEFLDKVVEVGDEMEKEMVKRVKEQEVVITTVATDIVQGNEEVVVTTVATDVVQVKEEIVVATIATDVVDVQVKEEIVVATIATDVVEMQEEVTKEDQSSNSIQ